MRFLLPLMLALTTCWASDPIFDRIPPQLPQQIPEGEYRLPNNVEPINYMIKLAPTFIGGKENFTFSGQAVISLQVNKNTKTIKLHAKNLNFDKSGFKLTHTTINETKTIKTHSVHIDEEKDIVILNLENELIAKTENISLSVNYTGKLNNELRGFYRSSYKDKNGNTKWLATTQFEPVGAREAFPCWDEPAIKAKFDIRIKVPTDPTVNYTAISNMPTEKEADEKDRKDKEGYLIFKPTPKMSTYLVAFVVSDFDKNSINKTELEKLNIDSFSVWAKPTAINDTQHALNFGWEVLKQLESFTDIKYSKTMKKMDQISIPDFAAGAMENWGLVTYRESRLLYTDKTTTENKQAIETVISHEFAHQWFGNLVTCDWWNYIWLNEGFATFFQYYITEKVYEQKEEEGRFMEQFVIKNLQASSFVTDASTKTRALDAADNIKTPAQIRSLFDDIAYKKGASILRMMQQFLTENIFQKGLNKYLNDYQEKTVTSDILFKSIHDSNKTEVEKVLPTKENEDKNKDAVPIPLIEVMENWVKKPGYPVVTVKLNRTNENNTEVTFEQERFFLIKPTKSDTTKWYIPINYVTSNAPSYVLPENKPHWLEPENNPKLSINTTGVTNMWILLNKNQAGYYRVNYDEENWQLLVNALRTESHSNISATNRAQLIDDALNLARAGHLSYKTSLTITKYLDKETNYIPWYAAARAFNYLDNRLQGTDKEDYKNYHKYVTEKIEAFENKANYSNKEYISHIGELAKVLALNTACKYGSQKCIQFAMNEFTEWLNGTQLSPDLRSGILCTGLRNANQKIWNDTLDKYKSSTNEDERSDIRAGLGCVIEEQVVQNFLARTLEKNPDIDIFATINSIIAGNSASFNVIIEFINKNFDEIQTADPDKKLLTTFLNKLADRVTTKDQFMQLSLLVHKLQFQEGQQTSAALAALTDAMDNLDWIENHRGTVITFINSMTQGQEPGSPDNANSITLTSFLLILPILLTRF